MLKELVKGKAKDSVINDYKAGENEGLRPREIPFVITEEDEI